jgi:transcriptional regulator with XRE-family HTH domain
MLSERMKWLRTVAGLSQREVAALADISAAYPGQIESGTKSNLGTEIALKLATLFGITLDALVSGADWPPVTDVVVAAVERARRLRDESRERTNKGAA